MSDKRSAVLIGGPRDLQRLTVARQMRTIEFPVFQQGPCVMDYISGDNDAPVHFTRAEYKLCGIVPSEYHSADETLIYVYSGTK